MALLSSKPATYFPRWFVTHLDGGHLGLHAGRDPPVSGGDLPARGAVRRRLAAAPTTSSTSPSTRPTRCSCSAVARRAAGLALAPALSRRSCFAVLPMQTESVAWITGRVDSMPACFFLAAFLLFVALARRAAAPATTPGRWPGAVVALFSKQNTVILAPCLMVYDLVVARPAAARILELAAAVRAVRRADRRSTWRCATRSSAKSPARAC